MHISLSMRVFLLDSFLEVQLLGKCLGSCIKIFDRYCFQKAYVTKFNSLKSTFKKFAGLSAGAWHCK